MNLNKNSKPLHFLYPICKSLVLFKIRYIIAPKSAAGNGGFQLKMLWSCCWNPHLDAEVQCKGFWKEPNYIYLMKYKPTTAANLFEDADGAAAFHWQRKDRSTLLQGSPLLAFLSFPFSVVLQIAIIIVRTLSVME